MSILMGQILCEKRMLVLNYHILWRMVVHLSIVFTEISIDVIEDCNV